MYESIMYKVLECWDKKYGSVVTIESSDFFEATTGRSYFKVSMRYVGCFGDEKSSQCAVLHSSGQNAFLDDIRGATTVLDAIYEEIRKGQQELEDFEKEALVAAGLVNVEPEPDRPAATDESTYPAEFWLCHGVTQFMQPKPARNPGGDCFACALKAVIAYLFKDDVSFDLCFNAFCGEHKDSDPDNTWIGFQNALRMFEVDYPDLIYSVDLVEPEFKPYVFSHAFYNFHMETPWAERLREHMEDGFVAVCEMNFEGAGPVDSEGKLNTTNHFAVIDGLKGVWEPNQAGTGDVLRYYAHVVCSVKGAYWITVEDLLRKHGVAGLILVRKSSED